MSVPLTKTDSDELKRILRYLGGFSLEADRKTLIHGVFAGFTGGKEVLADLNLSGEPRNAASLLIDTLAGYNHLLPSTAAPPRHPLLILADALLIYSGAYESGEGTDRVILERIIREYEGQQAIFLDVSATGPAFYLIDRDDQVESLASCYGEDGPPSGCKMMCLVYGATNQGPDLFLERLEQRTLVEKVLRLGKSIPVKHYTLSWPLRPKAPGGASPLPNDIPRLLKRSLLEELEIEDGASLEQARDKLAGFNVPVVFETQFVFQDFRDIWEESLKEYFRFWEDFPDSKTNQWLLAILFVNFHPSGKPRGFFKLPRRSPHKKIEGFISKENFNNFPTSHRIALPMLQGITKTETDHWLDDESSRRSLNFRRIGSEIGNIYQDSRGITRVPLNDLINELDDLFDKYRHTLQEAK